MVRLLRFYVLFMIAAAFAVGAVVFTGDVMLVRMCELAALLAVGLALA